VLDELDFAQVGMGGKPSLYEPQQLLGECGVAVVAGARHHKRPTIAEMLKPLGYATGQFGKNHLGDKDEFLPTAHGFDEFYGNLYHLNAEEEPEHPDYPKDPEFRKKFGPRGVIHSFANPNGTQKIEDTGPLTKHMNSWPDAAMTPFRSEKNSNWEGAYRVPALVRWPGKIQPGTVSNEIMSHLDWLPTLVAAAGDPDITNKLLKGYNPGGTTYKVHLDGYNFVPYFTGQEKKGPRQDFFYFSDEGDLTGLRFDNWKFVFAEQRAPGTLQVWAEPFVHLRIPKLFNLRADPYERADVTSNTYWDWYLDHAFLLVPAQQYVGKFLATFKDFPARQKAASFTIDQILETQKSGG
jgi:arylsulfatase A-like enzyme